MRLKASSLLRLAMLLASFAILALVATQEAYPMGMHKPTVRIINPPNHIIVGGKVQICAQALDLDGDRLKFRWSADRQRRMVGAHGSRLTNARGMMGDGRCVAYTAPSTHGWDTIRIFVSEVGRPNSISWDFVRFCVLADDFNGLTPDPGPNCYGWEA